MGEHKEKSIRLVCSYDAALDILRIGGSITPELDLITGFLTGEVGCDKNEKGEVTVIFYE